MSLRRKEVADYYKNRAELSSEEAQFLFCRSDVLSVSNENYNNGVKLCTHLLLERLDAAKAWELIRSSVVRENPSKDICLQIGAVLRRAYRDAGDSRSNLANFIFKPLMEHCILVKRKYAEKFSHILRGATLDRDEHMSLMLFETSRSIVWRYLNATNAHIRQGAFFVQCSVFPPSSGNGITDVDYLNEHCDAFLNALRDPSLNICIESIERVCENFSIYYDLIPDLYKEKIFNELATLANDKNYQIRAALYHGLRHFHDCALAIRKFEALLKAICKGGIDDLVDHVRCNVFRLLVFLSDSKINILDLTLDDEPILSAEEVLYRLDFEESEVVEREISSLLFTTFFERDMSNESRYKVLYQLCHINRRACLDLHRLLYTFEIAEVDCVFTHVISVLTVCLRMIQTVILKKNDLIDQRLAKYDFDSYIENEDTTCFDENNDTNRSDSIDKMLTNIKDVLDCMIVCYATMRYDPNFNTNIPESLIVSRHLSEIAHELITHFELRDELIDSALSIISLVRNAGTCSAKIKKTCSAMLCSGHLNIRYLEIFGLIDMEDLLRILGNGLNQLESSLFNNGNTSIRKRAFQSNKFAKKESVIEALNMLLNLPSCNQYIVEEFMHYITQFIGQLKRICDIFVGNIQDGTIPQMSLFFECWKLLTILMILKHNQDVYANLNNETKRFPVTSRRSTAIPSQIESEKDIDPMLCECEWMEKTLKSHPKLNSNADLLKFFYETINLHLSVYKHFKSSIKMAIKCVKDINGKKKRSRRKDAIHQSYQICLESAKSALEYAEND